MAAGRTFDEVAAVALEELVVIVPDCHALPETARDWPVRFAPAIAAQVPEGPYVVCGRLAAVEALLCESAFGSPLYVITDSPEPRVRGLPNEPVSGLDVGAWEPAVAARSRRPHT